MRYYAVLLVIFLLGCSHNVGRVKKVDDGVVFDMRKPGKMIYTDGIIEAEIDTREPSVLEDIIKIYTLKLIEGGDD